MACYSRLRSFKVTKQQSERDFPQVVNSNLRHICHHIHDTASKTLLPTAVLFTQMDRYPISGSIKFSCEKQVPGLSLPTDERCIILHSFFWTLLAQRPKNCSVHTFNARSKYDISKLMHGMYIPEFYKPRVNLFMGLSSFSFTQ